MATVSVVVVVWFAVNALIVLRLAHVSKQREDRAVVDQPTVDQPETSGLSVSLLPAFAEALPRAA